MTTTLEILQKKARLKVYESLEIKRRYSDGYEADWLDITSYLRSDNAPTVSQKLDFESFGYGQFKTGSASFAVDNLQGAFNDEADFYSLFVNSMGRHYTKVQYKAGYKDENDVNIDEVTFQGLINEKTITLDINSGTFTFTAMAYESIMSERTIPTSVMNTNLTAKQVIAIIMADTTITSYINYVAGNINPGNDITFDNPIIFEGANVADALSNICQKTSSVWYIDSNQNLIVRSREVNAITPFAFVGGAQSGRECNILMDGISSYDPGYTRIINQVEYTSGQIKYITSAVAANLERYGTNQLQLSGEDLTTPQTIQDISLDIINENSVPKPPIVVRTYYMPNVIGFMDPTTIDYRPKIEDKYGLPTLTFNLNSFNDGNYFARYQNRNIITTDYSYVYYGFEHNVAAGYTDHFLIRQ